MDVWVCIEYYQKLINLGVKTSDYEEIVQSITFFKTEIWTIFGNPQEHLKMTKQNPT